MTDSPNHSPVALRRPVSTAVPGYEVKDGQGATISVRRNDGRIISMFVWLDREGRSDADLAAALRMELANYVANCIVTDQWDLSPDQLQSHKEH